MQENLTRALASTLGAAGTPVFLADFNSHKSELTLHVRAGSDTAKLRSDVRSAMEQAGQAFGISVRSHSLRKLAYPRSLEHWEKRFGTGELVYDPTMILSRARGLVAAAKACRVSRDAVSGFFFDPDRRALYVLARGKSDAATMSNLRSCVAAMCDRAWNRESWISVQVVSELPRREMVPVDADSASLSRRLGRAIRRWLAPVAFAAVAGIAVPAAASSDVNQAESHPISTSTARAGNFGVLAGLSLFSDGQLRHELDAFAAAGLRQYFGSSEGDIIRLVQQAKKKVAQRGKKKRDPDEVGQVPGGPGS
jgi:hypothetical protein